MGKNKGKKSHVFKVAGAKSFKSTSKQKAKAVNTKLKDLKVKVKDQIAQMDKDLVNVQDKIHLATTSSKKAPSSSPQPPTNRKKTTEDQSKAFANMQTDKETMPEAIDQ